MKILCEVCKGSGFVPGDFGAGKKGITLPYEERKKLKEQVCPACGGTGMQEIADPVEKIVVKRIVKEKKVPKPGFEPMRSNPLKLPRQTPMDIFEEHGLLNPRKIHEYHHFNDGTYPTIPSWPSHFNHKGLYSDYHQMRC
jgi:hypothetical protein